MCPALCFKTNAMTTNANTLLLFLFITTACSFAQSIKRESISSAGASNSGTGVHVSQTVGQPYNTTTNQSGKTSYHPGFQQSVFSAELISSTIKASIVPNPALQSFFIIASDTLFDGTLTVFDEAGRVIYTEYIDSFNKHEVFCALWANGAYVVNFTDRKGNLVSARLIKHQ